MNQTLKTINQENFYEYKVSVMQDELSCGDLIYDMVTIVNYYIREILKSKF